MQLITGKRLASVTRRENRFPLDAFWGMGIYSQSKTTGFIAWAQIQFSHRWENWESIRERWESIPSESGSERYWSDWVSSWKG
ncbi:hypothetical protein Pan181_25690 [Aeoliella mucimassa]|uniref:Uncharacterized protein n=1 Tax=Aeoliella mucimassa TaxID=2527972 RepID=A0A518ANR6_9BACT|nr:hypothetical protein Pan181_25690 [Aeoliella mucimassa]